MTLVESPCVGICELDFATDLCIGCFRSRAEVASWGSASIEMKQEILQKVRDRRLARKKDNYE